MINLIQTIFTILLSAATSFFITQKTSKSDYSRKIADEILKDIFSQNLFPTLVMNKDSNNNNEILELLESFSLKIQNSEFSPYLIELYLAAQEVVSVYDSKEFEKYYPKFLNMYDFTLQNFRGKAGLPVYYSLYNEKNYYKWRTVYSILCSICVIIIGSCQLNFISYFVPGDVIIYIQIVFYILLIASIIVFFIYNHLLNKARKFIIRNNILADTSALKKQGTLL